jgi:hypothetical protein
LKIWGCCGCFPTAALIPSFPWSILFFLFFATYDALHNRVWGTLISIVRYPRFNSLGHVYNNDVRTHFSTKRSYESTRQPYINWYPSSRDQVYGPQPDAQYQQLSSHEWYLQPSKFLHHHLLVLKCMDLSQMSLRLATLPVYLASRTFLSLVLVISCLFHSACVAYME